MEHKVDHEYVFDFAELAPLLGVRGDLHWGYFGGRSLTLHTTERLAETVGVLSLAAPLVVAQVAAAEPEPEMEPEMEPEPKLEMGIDVSTHGAAAVCRRQRGATLEWPDSRVSRVCPACGREKTVRHRAAAADTWICQPCVTARALSARARNKAARTAGCEVSSAGDKAESVGRKMERAEAVISAEPEAADPGAASETQTVEGDSAPAELAHSALTTGPEHWLASDRARIAISDACERYMLGGRFWVSRCNDLFSFGDEPCSPLSGWETALATISRGEQRSGTHRQSGGLGNVHWRIEARDGSGYSAIYRLRGSGDGKCWTLCRSADEPNAVAA